MMSRTVPPAGIIGRTCSWCGTWTFSTNDLLANVGVLAAGLLVAWLGRPWPDLAVGFAIAHSPLVKTAMFASDPNLGRILAAIGNAGLDDLEVAKVQLYLGQVLVAENGGRAKSYEEAQGKREMQAAEITARVILNRGKASATIWTCDFSYDYVKINAEYRS